MPGIGGAFFVNRGHPILKGAVSWWLARPHLMGGARLVDALNRQHGALISGPKWAGHSGDRGALLFAAASSQYVDLGVPSVVTYPFTVTTWFRMAPGLTRWLGCISSTTSDNHHFDWGVLDAGGLFIEAKDTASSLVNTTNTVDDRWYFGALRFVSATNRRVSLNCGTEAVDTVSVNPVGPNSMSLGVLRRTSLAGPWNGYIGDTILWNRDLSTTEVRQWYDLSRSGYPGVLMRRQAALRSPVVPVVGAKIIFRNRLHV